MELALPLPIRGLIIGFTIAAAVGPISLLVIRRTLAHGGIYGFASGLGVATADASYAGIAAFGLTAVTSAFVSGKLVLGIVGGLIIALLGVLAGLGLVSGSSFLDAAVLTLAVWAGSALWWVVLTSIVAWLRERVSTRALLWVNRISGAALVVFGIVAVAIALA